MRGPKKWRGVLTAACCCLFAAIGKRAARRQLREIRHLTGNGVKPPAACARHRTRGDKSAGIGVLGLAQHLDGGSLFDNPPGIHYDDPFGHLRDYPQIVGDQQHRHLAFARAVPYQTQDLRLHGDIQRGSWFIRYQ